MKISKIERLNKLKEYLLNTYPEGRFSANNQTFYNIVGSGFTNYYLKLLVKEKFLIRIIKGSSSTRFCTESIYMIINNDKDNK